MDSKKNVKGNRKMLEVEYAPVIDYYKIPDGLDLDDKTIVEEYWVKWRILYIRYVGIEEIEKHEPTYEGETDFKRPADEYIVDAEHCPENPYETEDDEQEPEQE